MADLPIDPMTGGLAAISTAIATAVASAVASVRGKGGGLTDEERQGLAKAGQTLTTLEQRLATLEGQIATLAADVAAHRSEDAGLRGSLADLHSAVTQIATDARPALSGWHREQERLRAIETKGDERKAIEEETARQVRALHDRLDSLVAQLREQLPPGLSGAMEGLISGVTALRHALEDRLPRRDR